MKALTYLATVLIGIMISVLFMGTVITLGLCLFDVIKFTLANILKAGIGTFLVLVGLSIIFSVIEGIVEVITG